MHLKRTTGTLAGIAASLALSSPLQAADQLNVAFFLEWATPNLIAKAESAYEEALGVDVNWVNFEAGTAMTEAMLAGDIDISYSQGLSPFIAGVNASAPIKTVAVAVEYPANPCIVANGENITADNASELEGKNVAVPLLTMADYSYRLQMEALGVDLDEVTVVDQVPADAAVSLADGNVAMACIFGGDSIKKALESGTQLMTNEAMAEAGIISFDVVSVTEAFAQENPDMVRTFLEVTDEYNQAFAEDQSKLNVIAQESGMDEDTTKNQMNGFIFPSLEDQMDKYFNDGGLAGSAFEFVGQAFATDENPALEDYSTVIDTSFID